VTRPSLHSTWCVRTHHGWSDAIAMGTAARPPVVIILPIPASKGHLGPTLLPTSVSPRCVHGLRRSVQCVQAGHNWRLSRYDMFAQCPKPCGSCCQCRHPIPGPGVPGQPYHANQWVVWPCNTIAMVPVCRDMNTELQMVALGVVAGTRLSALSVVRRPKWMRPQYSREG
jgi:hypothetical protein